MFERESGGDQWVHSATLVASDGRSGFGKAVVTNGATTVVGAGVWPRVGPGDGAAYVFQRIPGRPGVAGTVQLRGDHERRPALGASVAVSGTTIVVGAPYPYRGATGPGSRHSSSREDEDGISAWGEVSEADPASRFPGPRFRSTLFGAQRLRLNSRYRSSRERALPRAALQGIPKRRGSMSFRAVAAG